MILSSFLIFPIVLLLIQALRKLFYIEGPQIFQKGETSRPFEAT